MDDLINRDSARRIIESPRNKEQMLMALTSLPSVYPKQNKGHWIRDTSHGFGVFNWKCSKCGHIIVATTPDRYCGACGCDNNINKERNRKEDETIATTTFDRHFSVPKVKEDEFVNEMTSKPSPTLRKGFQSHYNTEKSLRKELRSTLSAKDMR